MKSEKQKFSEKNEEVRKTKTRNLRYSSPDSSNDEEEKRTLPIKIHSRINLIPYRSIDHFAIKNHTDTHTKVLFVNSVSDSFLSTEVVVPTRSSLCNYRVNLVFPPYSTRDSDTLLLQKSSRQKLKKELSR